MERVNYESLIIQDLLNFHSDGSLQINPWYQRRSVWTNPQRSYLVNTIHENKPVPSIYIRHTIDVDNERSIKEVVDGQQRIKTLIAYKNDEFPARHPGHPDRVLFSDLNRNEKAAFLGTSLSVGYLIGASDQDVIEIFGRINSVAKTLNPQEKRNARFSGEFKQFCLRQAAERLPFWRSAQIFTAAQIARMQEVQFLSDFVVNMMGGLTDFSATKIDNHYKRFDDEFPQGRDIAVRLENLFIILVENDPKTFSDTMFRYPQILFSLMVVLDAERQANFTSDQISNAIFQVDGLIGGYGEMDELTEIQRGNLLGFTGGNLHRIRARRVRDQVIRETLL